jgi:hypothetical protein
VSFKILFFIPCNLVPKFLSISLSQVANQATLHHATLTGPAGSSGRSPCLGVLELRQHQPLEHRLQHPHFPPGSASEAAVTSRLPLPFPKATASVHECNAVTQVELWCNIPLLTSWLRYPTAVCMFAFFLVTTIGYLYLNNYRST